MQEVLIVGAGITGLTAALDLAAVGRPVRLVERREAAGGYAGRYGCKAVEACRQCGACLVDDALRRVRGEPLIRLELSTEVRDLERSDLGVAATLVRSGAEERLAFPAVILGSGFTPFNPRQKPHLGHGRIPNIITGLDLETMLRTQGAVLRPSDGLPPGRMAFVQCVGSRDASLNRLYCSRVCCGYALRSASLIRRSRPDLEIVFFYMDVQTFGRHFHDLWPRLKDEVRMVREIPGEYYRVEGDRVGVVVPYPEGPREEVFDLLVLSVGMTPGPFGERWAESLGLELDPDGFLPADVFGGVAAAGSATGPMTITECVADAHRAAAEVLRFLEAAP